MSRGPAQARGLCDIFCLAYPAASAICLINSNAAGMGSGALGGNGYGERVLPGKDEAIAELLAIPQRDLTAIFELLYTIRIDINEPRAWPCAWERQRVNRVAPAECDPATALSTVA